MIVAAISATMMAPDAQQHLPMLDALLKTVVSQVQKAGPQPGQGGPPGGGQPPPGGGGAPPGGPPSGTNIQSLMGGGGQGGPAGPSQPSPSGISSDDLRRAVASQAGTAG
jgi:hypothetical protein